MAGPLVEAKLYVPQLRRGVVARSRLRQRLASGEEATLTLVSAPAGFGKTTLLADWLSPAPAAGPAAGRSVAWLSLEPSDRAPAAFWTYLVTALRAAAPGVGASALSLLQSAQAPLEAVLATVLNDLRALPHDLYLVLDDYHLVDSPGIQTQMASLLEHLPRQVHLVISTRADPALPLARLRARGELVEIRASDLRFTSDEATAYVNGSAGLGLAAADVAVLAERTEGWIAALQLAVLSMRGRPDVASFLAGFAGDDRYVVDYLVEEVLDRQPGDVRAFLVHTSILDRLTGPLCDAVTARPGSATTLEALERGNMFVVPLDDQRRWYRYHHLFRDVLHTYLLAEAAAETAELHRRASRWFEETGEPALSVRHALDAGDIDRAAGLAELALPELRRTRQEATIRGWLDLFPAEVVHARPVLALGLVGSLMARLEVDELEERLTDIERWLPPPDAPAATWTPPAGMVVVDEPELARLPGAVELYRTGLALVSGDHPAVLRHARLVAQRAAPDDHVVRGGAAALAGLALWSQGDLEGAYRAYSVCVDGLRRAGHLSDVLGCTITLADIRITQGRRRDATATCEQALLLASPPEGPLRGAADMHVALSELAYQQDDLASAAAHLRRADELGPGLGLPQNPYRSLAALARLAACRGDLDEAVDLLADARRVYVGDFSPDVRPLAASRARLLVARGRLAEAQEWVRDRGLAAEDDLSYLREFEHVTLARLLLARRRAERTRAVGPELAGLLSRLLEAAEAGGRTGTVIEVQVLQALARQADGDTAGAATALERALALAEPEGYVRVVVDEGRPAELLLRSVVRRRPGWGYARRLLDACGPATAAGSAPPGTGRAERLVDPLSGRELDVLRLLASELSGPDIARELTVSVNTLRTHTKNIYAKLGASTRREAVRRAQDLQLLSRRER